MCQRLRAMATSKGRELVQFGLAHEHGVVFGPTVFAAARVVFDLGGVIGEVIEHGLKLLVRDRGCGGPSLEFIGSPFGIESVLDSEASPDHVEGLLCVRPAFDDGPVFCCCGDQAV